jgi:peptide/nickel transport system substrate-binding protein
VKGAKEHAEGAAPKIAGIKVVDDYTIGFELTEPDATFLSFVAGYYGPDMLPFHKLKDVPPDQFEQHDWNTKPGRISLGPFINTGREKDQFVEYTRNDTYFKGKPLLDKIVFRVMTPDVALAALQKGEVDIASLPAREVPNLRGNPKVRIFTYPVNLHNALMFNLTLSQLQDVRIRQAILHALDRKTYVERVLRYESRQVV